jgi:hypothetical protein
MLLTLAKNHSSYSILENGISLFRYSYSNNTDSLHDQHYLSESSSLPSNTDPNYQQNQGSKLDTVLETETKVSTKPPFIKKNTSCR